MTLHLIENLVDCRRPVGRVYLVWCRRNRGVIRTTPHFRNDAWRVERVAWCRRETGRDLWIQWDDVDLDGGFLKIVTGRNGHRTKGGKSRWVPISPRLRVALREHSLRYRAAKYDGQLSPWVFHHTKTRRHHKTGKRIRSLYSAFKAAAERAKLPPEFVQHDLRHRRVTKWLAAESSAVLLKKAVGHADLRTTMAYTHLAREHLHGLVDEPHPEETRNRA